MTSFHAEKCCRLMSEHAASARCIFSRIRRFLIHCTFAVVAFTRCPNERFIPRDARDVKRSIATLILSVRLSVCNALRYRGHKRFG